MFRGVHRNEKTFENYLQVPPEVRRIMVNKMGPRDRCRYAGCSKLSLKEAKSSKNYIYGLSFTNVCDEINIISVFFSENNESYGFKLLFENRDGHFLSCKTMQFDELWRTEYDSSVDMFHFGLAHFKDLLSFYQNSIKVLRIDENNANTEQINYGIGGLRKLEILKVNSKFDIRQFLSKIGHPLKELIVEGIANSRNLGDWEQLYQVQNHLRLPDIQLNYQQFLRLSAKYVLINLGAITEQNIFDFLTSWQNGTYTGNIKKCDWLFGNSGANSYRVLQSVRIINGAYNGIDGNTYIRHRTSGEFAKLTIFYQMLRFSTQREEVERQEPGNEEEEDEQDMLPYFRQV